MKSVREKDLERLKKIQDDYLNSAKVSKFTVGDIVLVEDYSNAHTYYVAIVIGFCPNANGAIYIIETIEAIEDLCGCGTAIVEESVKGRILSARGDG